MTSRTLQKVESERVGCTTAGLELGEIRQPVRWLPNYTVLLWLLKLGALVNLYLLAHAGAGCAGRSIVLPAQIFSSSRSTLLHSRSGTNTTSFHDSIFWRRSSRHYPRPSRRSPTSTGFSRVLRLSASAGRLGGRIVWLDGRERHGRPRIRGPRCLTGRLELYFFKSSLAWLLIFHGQRRRPPPIFYLITDMHGGRQALLVTSLVGAVTCRSS